MTQSRRHLPLRSRRIRALIAGLALAMLVLGLSGVRSTMAGWTDSEETSGSFSAAKIGPVENLICINQGLGGLLSKKVKLEWGEPQSPSPVPFEYQIIAKKTTVVTGTVTTKTFSTNQTSLMYTDNNLISVSRYEFTVQQKAKNGGWVGSERTAEASGIAVLLGVTMLCGTQ